MNGPVVQIAVILCILLAAMWIGGVFALRKDEEDNHEEDRDQR